MTEPNWDNLKLLTPRVMLGARKLIKVFHLRDYEDVLQEAMLRFARIQLDPDAAEPQLYVLFQTIVRHLILDKFKNETQHFRGPGESRRLRVLSLSQLVRPDMHRDELIILGECIADKQDQDYRVLERQSILTEICMKDPIFQALADGKKYDEIARDLGVPIGTIRSRLARAREKMRTLLEGLVEEA